MLDGFRLQQMQFDQARQAQLAADAEEAARQRRWGQAIRTASLLHAASMARTATRAR